MFSKIRPSHGTAIGVALVCALGLVASYIDAPLSPESPATSSIPSISTHVSADNTESDAPHPSESPLLNSAFPSEPPPAPTTSLADRGILLARECLTLAERDPLAAMEMAAAHQLHAVDPGLAASLMTQWAAKDFARAYEWTKSQETGAWRDDMLARLSYVRAQVDPVAAARLVVSDIPAGRARDEAVISVVHQWALRDARSAMRWVQSFPDEELRQRASDEVTGLATASSRANATH